MNSPHPADLWHFERVVRTKGHVLVAGIDEVGRGPLAGPVVAACVVLPLDFDLAGIGDSKNLTEKQRNTASGRILRDALSIGFGIIDAATIDDINILKATHLAMKHAILSMMPAVDATHVLVDGRPVPTLPIRSQTAIVKGDAKSASIASASIVAKVKRDALMQEYHDKHPEYGFNKHKGYASPEHMSALTKHGPCPLHRYSFAPVRLSVAPCAGTDNLFSLGKFGENAAQALLQDRGYRIIGANIRPFPGTGSGEIDIVAWDGSTLAFVEVKTRMAASSIVGSPAEAVGARKQRQIINLANAYVGLHQLTDVPCRFDVIEVVAGSGHKPVLTLHKAAFDAT